MLFDCDLHANFIKNEDFNTSQEKDIDVNGIDENHISINISKTFLNDEDKYFIYLTYGKNNHLKTPFFLFYNNESHNNNDNNNSHEISFIVILIIIISVLISAIIMIIIIIILTIVCRSKRSRNKPNKNQLQNALLVKCQEGSKGNTLLTVNN
jgi:hypothetical protein